MKTYNIHQTKTQLSALLRDVDKGQTITFGERGQAQYQINKFIAKKVDRSKAFGIWKDKIKINGDIVGPDPDIAKTIEEGPLFPE